MQVEVDEDDQTVLFLNRYKGILIDIDLQDGDIGTLSVSPRIDNYRAGLRNPGLWLDSQNAS